MVTPPLSARNDEHIVILPPLGESVNPARQMARVHHLALGSPCVRFAPQAGPPLPSFLLLALVPAGEQGEPFPILSLSCPSRTTRVSLSRQHSDSLLTYLSQPLVSPGSPLEGFRVLIHEAQGKASPGLGGETVDALTDDLPPTSRPLPSEDGRGCWLGCRTCRGRE